MSIRPKKLESAAIPSSGVRRRFAAWSLAVLGAISTSSGVTLPPAAAWGYDDPAKNEKKEGKGTEEQAFNREVFSELIAAKKYDEAGAKLDAAKANAPGDPQLLMMEMQLASLLSRTDAAASKARIANIKSAVFAKEELDAQSAMLLMQVTSFQVMGPGGLTYEERIAACDEAIEKLKQSKQEASPALQSLMTMRIRTMVMENKTEEAKVALDTLLAQAKESIADKPGSLSSYLSLVSLYNSSLREEFPDAASAATADADALLKKLMDSEEATPEDYIAFVNYKSSMASSLMYTDAKLSQQILAEVEKTIEAGKAKFSDNKLLANLERSTSSLKGRVEQAIMRDELIGTQAPPIIADHFVATKPVTMEELQGKVVLLDFWAVWCGPCIATFPHLIEWHEKYADKGLVILGATNFYQYKWDESAGGAVRAEQGEEVSAEDELAMLEKFREHHKLHHGFFVNSKESGYSKAFAVSGIPKLFCWTSRARFK